MYISRIIILCAIDRESNMNYKTEPNILNMWRVP